MAREFSSNRTSSRPGQLKAVVAEPAKRDLAIERGRQSPKLRLTPLPPMELLQLHRKVGNHAVARLLSSRDSSPNTETSHPVTNPLHDSIREVQTGPVVQRGKAGHKEAWSRSVDGQWIVKVTSAREARVYAQDAAEQGIAGVMPELKAVLDSKEELSTLEIQPKNPLRDLLPGEKVVVIRNLAQRNQQSKPLVLDAKIGFSTGSATQALAEAKEDTPGSDWADTQKRKKIEKDAKKKGTQHAWMDAFKGSKSKGYRIEPDESEFVALQLFANTPGSESPTGAPAGQLATAFTKIAHDIRAVYQEMSRSEVVFIGSSILMVIDSTDPETSTATMIDFAHPVYKKQDGAHFKKYAANYLEGLQRLMADVELLARQLTAKQQSLIGATTTVD